MICASFKGTDGATIIACRSGRRGGARCDVCGTERAAHWECDGPSRRKNGKGTCDRKLCEKCRRHVEGEDRDLCPECNHGAQSRLPLEGT